MKSKANKIVSLFFALIMVFVSTALSYAANTDITKTDIFYSKTKNYNYAADKEIRQNGKTYKLKNIKYELVADKKKPQLQRALRLMVKRLPLR